MAQWSPDTLTTALNAELSPAERARPFSHWHPALRSCFTGVSLHQGEWERIGILDSLPDPDGRPLTERVLDAHPSPLPADRRLIHAGHLEIRNGQPVIDVTCKPCGLKTPTFAMVDVRALPELVEKPILAIRNQPKSVTGYAPPSDLKGGAGFVCSGCWSTWVRMGFKIDGVVYTRLQHITALGAPANFIADRAKRPGWGTVGFRDN